jgi:hypothetical protein
MTEINYTPDAIAHLVSSVIFFAIAVIFFVKTAYHFGAAMDGRKHGKRIYFHLLGPFAFAFDDFFTDEGIYHRNKLGKFLMLFVISGGIFCLLQAIWPHR